MIIVRTPLRASYLGGGSDFSSWFLQHNGLVVGAAINQYSYITARHLPPFHPYKSRFVYSDIETVQQHDKVAHRAISGVLRHLKMDGVDAPALEIFHACDLPGRSGTGSSSSFVVGLLNALFSLTGKASCPDELRAMATFVEQVEMKEIVGCQDQAFAAYGGLNEIKFRKSGDVDVFPLPLTDEQTKSLEYHTMLFFTGMTRTSSDVAATYVKKLSGDSSQWALVRLAEQGVQAILDGKHERLGELIDKSWRLKSGLSEAVSNEKISKLYASARLCGAWGGKITGAGGGGCLLLIAPLEKQQRITTTLVTEGCVRIPFKFDFSGSRVIFASRS